MEGIAELLGQLSDEAARVRVLQWVDSVYRRDEPARLETQSTLASAPMSVQRPAPTPTPVVASTPMPAPVAVAPILAEAVQQSNGQELSDSDLSFEGLEEWFEQPGASQPAASPSAISETAISETATWETVIPETVVSETGTLETGVSRPSALQPASANPPAAPAATSQPVVSLIHDFVTDFQRLARDWQES